MNGDHPTPTATSRVPAFVLVTLFAILAGFSLSTWRALNEAIGLLNLSTENTQRCITVLKEAIDGK